MKIKLRIIYTATGLLILYFFFSLFEIYNTSALYKDQVEFGAEAPPTNISSDYWVNLIKDASNWTSIIDFFIYSSISAPIIIVLLLSWANRLNRNNVKGKEIKQ